MLAAACIVATLGLTACDAAVETAREAQRDADQAARIAGSAGQPRASDALIEKVAETPLSERDTLDKQIGTGGNYITQESAEKDLLKASEKIRAALGSNLADNVKASLQAEAAHIALQLAAQRFANLQGRVDEIARQTMGLQQSGQLAVELGSEAAAISASVKAPTTEEVDKAKAALSQAQAALTRAQEEVTRLEREAAAKQEQARAIYARTQAAFQQADTLKGKEAIDAANKSIEESKQGDALMAEAGNLEPQLAAARTALAIAQVQQKDADRQVATATAAYEAGNAWVKQNTDRISALQDAAKKIVSGEKVVAAQYTEIATEVKELEPLIKEAFDSAEQARNLYGKAGVAHNGVMAGLSTWASDQQLAADDPLVRISRDARASALLNWGQESAAEQAGRIQAAGYHVATLVGGVKAVVDKAHQAAGMAAPPAAAMTGRADYQQAATAAFKAGLEAGKAGTDRTGVDVDRIKWIGWALQALANQGLALMAEGGQAKDYADAAKAAATSATATREATQHGNPDLLPYLRRAGIDVAG
jgi:hypothetical protein